ncbi:MAG: ribonuclease E/G, partial [Deltaproteobacteria bacterium]|nr:ribonuclease E/G [Deltaproteobacteria bacterium]
MSTRLVINALHHERRVGLVEKGSLAELFIERPSGRGLVGNIYKGKVVRVLAGMDAAFVDVALDKAGFLYVADVAKPTSSADLGLVTENVSDGDDVDQPLARVDSFYPSQQPSGITDLLHNGQEILVQVAKAPIGTKGARLTTHITLPGRLLVFLPTVDHIGISRRIESESERRRLKDLVEKLRPPDTGFIIR